MNLIRLKFILIIVISIIQTVDAKRGDYVDISAGLGHFMVLKVDHSLWGWGANSRGQVGNGSLISTDLPTKILDNVKQVSAGYVHTMALLNDGTLWAWGSNDYGMLGDGTNETRLRPVKILSNVQEVFTGPFCTLAILKDNSLWGWGIDMTGQVKGRDIVFNNRPVKILDGAKIREGVKQVSAGGNYIMIIMNDGSLWAWGGNDSGQLGDGTTTERYVPVLLDTNVKTVMAGGDVCIWLKYNDKLVITGMWNTDDAE